MLPYREGPRQPGLNSEMVYLPTGSLGFPGEQYAVETASLHCKGNLQVWKDYKLLILAQSVILILESTNMHFMVFGGYLLHLVDLSLSLAWLRGGKEGPYPLEVFPDMALGRWIS